MKHISTEMLSSLVLGNYKDLKKAYWAIQHLKKCKKCQLRFEVLRKTIENIKIKETI